MFWKVAYILYGLLFAALALVVVLGIFEYSLVRPLLRGSNDGYITIVLIILVGGGWILFLRWSQQRELARQTHLPTSHKQTPRSGNPFVERMRAAIGEHVIRPASTPEGCVTILLVLGTAAVWYSTEISRFRDDLWVWPFGGTIAWVIAAVVAIRHPEMNPWLRGLVFLVAGAAAIWWSTEIRARFPRGDFPIKGVALIGGIASCAYSLRFFINAMMHGEHLSAVSGPASTDALAAAQIVPEPGNIPAAPKSQEVRSSETPREFNERFRAFLDDTTNSVSFDVVDVMEAVDAKRGHLYQFVAKHAGQGDTSIKSNWQAAAKQLAHNVSIGAAQRGAVAEMLDFHITRSVSSMSPRERGLYRVLSTLQHMGTITRDAFKVFEWSLIFEGGNAVIVHTAQQTHHSDTAEKALTEYLQYVLLSPRENDDHALTLLNEVMNSGLNAEAAQFVKGELMGGNSWFGPEDLPGSIFETKTDASLRLGELDEYPNIMMQYSGQKSLFTVGPPGSGKSQTHAIPALLTYKGPCVILDVKGELWQTTSKWRAENVGEAFRFDILNPKQSASYNPFSLISDDDFLLWEDARFVASQLIVPTGLDRSWESAGSDLLTAIIAWMVAYGPEQHRNMGTVLDVIAGDTWERFITQATGENSFPALRRTAMSFAEMRKKADKQWEGVREGAHRHLRVWEGPRVESVTGKSDWTPERLRQRPYPSIYLCVDQIEIYASVLRTIIGQHIRYLISNRAADDDIPTLLLMDEMPRLGEFAPIREALETGRDPGKIKLWMFCQYLGQLRNSYGREIANGMLSACAVKLFLNPPMDDDTAKEVSSRLGYRESILEGKRELLIEPQDLAMKPEWKDLQIAIGDNAPPAKLKKSFAYKDKVLSGRMGEYSNG